MRALIVLLFLLPLGALTGCAGDTPATSRPASASSRPPPVIAAPGLQIMGGEAGALVALFGTPALDQREGPARKLQFRGPACVLDAYLYPPAGGGAARVKWIDTRNPLGNDMDRTSCIAALSRR